jgi:hypothetical protein
MSYDEFYNNMTMYAFKPGVDFFIRNGSVSSANPAGDLVLQTHSFGNTPDEISTHGRDIRLESRQHIYLRAARGLIAGRIYIRSGLTGYTADTLLRVPGTGDQPSTKILKTDFESINDDSVLNIFETINIVKYKEQMTGDSRYSFLIEDELDKQNDLFKSIIKREEGTYRFAGESDIPQFLQQYIGTEALVYNEEDEAYYFNPLVYDSVSLLNLAIQNLKINQKRINNLEERLQALEEQLNNE